MIVHPFEIKVALIGNVSAGKTTVLNALLRDKFGEVSMKRATAGINYFHLHSHAASDGSSVQSEATDASNIRSATSILTEISQDNIEFRKSEMIQEKHFDILAEEELFPMRDDTRLVFIDIPGINEANTFSRYSDYVSMKWDTFDCVVAILDGKQGVNTQDQVALLNLVKTNLKKKAVPIRRHGAGGTHV